MNNYTFVVLASTTFPLWAQRPLLLKQLEATKWETPYVNWRASHPGAKCAESGAIAQGADQQWCYRCTEISGTQTYEWSFYAWDVSAPVCRLEQLRASDAGPTPEASHRSLDAALHTRYGPSDTNNVVGEWSSGFWHDTRHFRDAQGEVYLYRRTERGKPDAAELLARSRQLVAARGEDRTLSDIEERYQSPTGTPLDTRLAKDLGREFPALQKLLHADPAQTDPVLQQQTLKQLLVAARGTREDRMLELLMAADRLAGLPSAPQTQTPTSYDRTGNIAGYTLRYRYSELGASWVYQHDLLEALWREHPQSEWGVAAFLQLQWTGWDPSGVCAKGTDQFRTVIAEGEKFLAGHPATPHRAELVLSLAEAYETWWSLSRAPSSDDYVTAGQYRDGAETALRKAMQLYESLPPDEPPAIIARRRLPRLKLGIDTVQRRFYCIYD
jgi:hypothetical protein